jgi:hypothetical protein
MSEAAPYPIGGRAHPEVWARVATEHALTTGALAAVGRAARRYSRSGHTRPVGPIGMTLFLAGIAWLELRPRREEADTRRCEGHDGRA